MPNILYVHPYNNYTGSTKVLSEVIKAKHKNLNTVTVITETSQDGFLSGLGVNLVNVPIIRWNHRAIPVLSAIVWISLGIFKTFRLIRKFDIVYINTILPGYAAIVARICGKQVVYHVHEKYVKKNAKSWFGEFVFNHVLSHRIFVSNYLKEQYMPKAGCTSEVVYNKLSYDFLQKVEVVPMEHHKRNHILMLATLQKGKGIDVFVEVARCLPDYMFSLVLSSPKEDIDCYFKMAIPINLLIYPKQADVHPFYKSADIIVNLSNPFFLVETFGLTIMEGMAYGLPAIVPNVGGPREVIEDGVTGYSIDVSDPSEVAKYIIMCTMPSEYNRLFNNSLNRVSRFIYKNEYE